MTGSVRSVGGNSSSPTTPTIAMLISPSVTYHLLMRYQWVLYLIGMTAFVSRYSGELPIGKLAEWLAFAFSVAPR